MSVLTSPHFSSEPSVLESGWDENGDASGQPSPPLVGAEWAEGSPGEPAEGPSLSLKGLQ